MKSLTLLISSVLLAATCSSCSSKIGSASAGNSGKKKITGLKPTTGSASPAVINATGDAFSPGINPHNRTTGSSEENATAIANQAISKANTINTNRMLRLDTLSTTEFLSRFSSSNIRQISITTAAAKNDSQRIKDYALAIMKDHQELEAELSKLSANAGTRPIKLIVNRIQASNTAVAQSNNQEYIQMTIREHQHMIKLLEAAGRSNDPALTTFAGKYLPVLKRHLIAAQELTIKQ